MTHIEHKLYTPDLKLLDDGSGSFEGYASTFANFDSVGERVVKGAFQQHLGDFLRDGFIAIGHDWEGLPIATPIEAREDDHGLYVKAAFHSTARAQEARAVVKERMERGKSVKLSIGYEVLDSENTKQGRLLKDLKLFEYSLVTVPANQLAAVTFAKALPPEGAPLYDYKTAMEVAHTAFLREFQSLEERRTKAGRMISEANLRVLDSALDAMANALDTLKNLRSAAQSTTVDEAATPVVDAKLHAQLEELFAAQQRLASKYHIEELTT